MFSKGISSYIWPTVMGPAPMGTRRPPLLVMAIGHASCHFSVRRPKHGVGGEVAEGAFGPGLAEHARRFPDDLFDFLPHPIPEGCDESLHLGVAPC